MTIQLGIQSYLMSGEEGAYGTAAARDTGTPHQTESIVVNEAKINADDLYLVDRHSGAHAQGNVDVAGSLTIVPRYQSRFFARMLKHLLGSVVTGQPDVTSNPTVYQSTFTPANVKQTGLTLEVVKGASQARLFTGMKVSRMRLSMAAGQKMSAVFDVMGRQGADTAQTPLSYVEGNMMVANNITLSWGGSNQANVLDGEFTIEDPLLQIRDLSSRFISEPQRNGKRKVSGSFKLYLQDASIYSDWRNATKKALILTITGPAITATYNYSLTITFPIGEIISGGDAPADNPAPLVIPVQFECFVNDVQANVLSAVLQNTNSSV